jgi:hypothetical protein
MKFERATFDSSSALDSLKTLARGYKKSEGTSFVEKIKKLIG